MAGSKAPAHSPISSDKLEKVIHQARLDYGSPLMDFNEMWKTGPVSSGLEALGEAMRVPPEFKGAPAEIKGLQDAMNKLQKDFPQEYKAWLGGKKPAFGDDGVKKQFAEVNDALKALKAAEKPGAPFSDSEKKFIEKIDGDLKGLQGKKMDDERAKIHDQLLGRIKQANIHNVGAKLGYIGGAKKIWQPIDGADLEDEKKKAASDPLLGLTSTSAAELLERVGALRDQVIKRADADVYLVVDEKGAVYAGAGGLLGIFTSPETKYREMFEYLTAAQGQTDVTPVSKRAVKNDEIDQMLKVFEKLAKENPTRPLTFNLTSDQKLQLIKDNPRKAEEIFGRIRKLKIAAEKLKGKEINEDKALIDEVNKHPALMDKAKEKFQAAEAKGDKNIDKLKLLDDRVKKLEAARDDLAFRVSQLEYKPTDEMREALDKLVENISAEAKDIQEAHKKIADDPEIDAARKAATPSKDEKELLAKLDGIKPADLVKSADEEKAKYEDKRDHAPTRPHI